MNKIILLFAIVLLGISCNINKSLTIEQLTNETWKLKSIEGLTDEGNSTFENATLSFSKSDSSYSGNNGCNMISGKFTISQGKFTFGDGLSTKRYCMGINEQKFNEVLKATNRMQTKKGVLFLFDNNKKLAEFIKKQ